MRKGLVLAVVAALAAGAFFFWTRRAPAPPQALTLHGNVDIRQVSLAFDGSGRIAEVRVEEGDHVRAGAVVATLDTRTLALQAEQAIAQIEAGATNWAPPSYSPQTGLFYVNTVEGYVVHYRIIGADEVPNGYAGAWSRRSAVMVPCCAPSIR